MFKPLGKFISKKRYTLFFSLALIVFSLAGFVNSMLTGEVVVINDSPMVQWSFRFIRLSIYLGLVLWINLKMQGLRKRFLANLLGVSVVIYELFIVFNLPKYLALLVGF